MNQVVRKSKPTAANSSPIYNNLSEYKKALYKRYMHPPHLDILDRALEDVTKFVETGGKEGTWLLIVAMPPRHGKTLTVSRFYPTWHLGRNPDHRAMLVSYGASLANKNSRYARAIMRLPAYKAVFDIELDPESRSVEAWDIKGHEGGADALGVLGGATGKGAHILIGDDLIKNRSEAESETIRERTWDALNDDLFSRLEPGGAAVMFATPWHQDDPIGRLVKMVQDPTKCNGPVKILKLVALTETDEDLEKDPLHRGMREALWPERYPVHVLEAVRKRVGPYSWSGLYKMSPTPSEGGLFKRKWFQPAHIIPWEEFDSIVRYWDLAMSAKTSADYTVGVKMGRTKGGQIYVLDVFRGQIDWGDLTEEMARTMTGDGPDIEQGIEQAGYMSKAVQDLTADPKLHQYSIWGYAVDTDKVTRALPYAARAAAGHVFVVQDHWTHTYVEELCAFDKGAHDDQVDASSGAYAMLGGLFADDSEIVEDENDWDASGY